MVDFGDCLHRLKKYHVMMLVYISVNFDQSDHFDGMDTIWDRWTGRFLYKNTKSLFERGFINCILCNEFYFLCTTTMKTLTCIYHSSLCQQLDRYI